MREIFWGVVVAALAIAVFYTSVEASKAEELPGITPAITNFPSFCGTQEALLKQADKEEGFTVLSAEGGVDGSGNVWQVWHHESGGFMLMARNDEATCVLGVGKRWSALPVMKR